MLISVHSAVADNDVIFDDSFEFPEPDTFSDCPDCPEMMALSAGSFVMGTPWDEPESSGLERPQHDVNVPAFALARTEVTFAQWDACAADGGCSHYPTDHGWGRGDMPVMNVNWHDAQDYVEWLSQKSGQNYRLPSEAEWEYAARAGTTGRFSIGDCITTDQANFYGHEPPEGCPVGIWRQRTVASASFAANPWGFYEMNGNVWELVQDCWNDGYYGEPPTNGSAWMSGDCDQAPIRGGAWATVGRCIRSGMRDSISRNDRFSDVGFRVARSVSP